MLVSTAMVGMEQQWLNPEIKQSIGDKMKKQSYFENKLPIDAVEKHIGFPKEMILNWVRYNTFPPPRKCSEKGQVWLMKEIEAWRIINRSPISFWDSAPIDDGLLTEGDIIDRAEPKPASRPGIYFLIKNYEIIYIGKSCAVDRRISEHMESRDFDAWYWIACPKKDLNELERIYLNKFMPHLNIDLGTKANRRKSFEIKRS